MECNVLKIDHWKRTLLVLLVNYMTKYKLVSNKTFYSKNTVIARTIYKKHFHLKKKKGEKKVYSPNTSF